MGQGFIRSDRDVKLLILYALSLLPVAVAEKDLLEVVMVDDGFGYFEFASAFRDLQKNMHIARVGGEKEDSFILTPRGQQVVDAMEPQIAMSVRYKANEAAKTLVARLRREESVKTYHVAKPDGTYTAKFRIVDSNQTMLSIDLDLVNEDQCVKAEKKFRAKAEQIYKYLLTELSQEDKSI